MILRVDIFRSPDSFEIFLKDDRGRIRIGCWTVWILILVINACGEPSFPTRSSFTLSFRLNWANKLLIEFFVGPIVTMNISCKYHLIFHNTMIQVAKLCKNIRHSTE